MNAVLLFIPTRTPAGKEMQSVTGWSSDLSLLTRLPRRIPSGMVAKETNLGLTAAGTVTDSHRIPNYPLGCQPLEEPITGCKDKTNFLNREQVPFIFP